LFKIHNPSPAAILPRLVFSVPSSQTSFSFFPNLFFLLPKPLLPSSQTSSSSFLATGFRSVVCFLEVEVAAPLLVDEDDEAQDNHLGHDAQEGPQRRVQVFDANVGAGSEDHFTVGVVEGAGVDAAVLLGHLVDGEGGVGGGGLVRGAVLGGQFDAVRGHHHGVVLAPVEHRERVSGDVTGEGEGVTLYGRGAFGESGVAQGDDLEFIDRVVSLDAFVGANIVNGCLWDDERAVGECLEVVIRIEQDAILEPQHALCLIAC